MDRRDAHHPYGLSHPYQARGRAWLSCRRHRLRTSPGPASRARCRPARPRVPAVARPGLGCPPSGRPHPARPRASPPVAALRAPIRLTGKQPASNRAILARRVTVSQARMTSHGFQCRKPRKLGHRATGIRVMPAQGGHRGAAHPRFPPSRPHFGHDLATPIGNWPDLRLCQVRKAVTPARSSARGRDCLPSGRERHGASARHAAALGGVGGQARQHGAHCPAARHRRRRDGRQARAPAAAGCGTTAVADLGTA